MTSKLLCLALLAPFALFVSCGLRLQPKYESGFNCFHHLESIPIIVVARIEPKAVSIVGKPFTIDSLPGDPVGLLKVKVSIENVLKGDVSNGDTEVLYFTQATPHGPAALGFFGTVPFRDILFLRQERGRLRIVRDVVLSSTCSALVYSGAHLNFKSQPSESLREEMVDLLLTPGTGATELGMVRAIFERAPIEISPEYTERILLKLAASEPPVVRTAACLAFRDIMADLLTTDPEKASALSEQLGVSASELARWRQEQEQNGEARTWWAGLPLMDKLPSTSLPANGAAGLSLCTNDNALGVPQVWRR